MASQVPGISTLAATLSYAIESTAGTKPTAFTLLHRINAIDEIALETETIDASALEDTVEKSIAGRDSTGGTYGITVNVTNETITEWETLISAYNAVKADEKALWMQEIYPALNKAFFIKVEPPSQIPKPAAEQNSLLTVTMTMTIVEYMGTADKITPTESTGA